MESRCHYLMRLTASRSLASKNEYIVGGELQYGDDEVWQCIPLQTSKARSVGWSSNASSRRLTCSRASPSSGRISVDLMARHPCQIVQPGLFSRVNGRLGFIGHGFFC